MKIYLITNTGKCMDAQYNYIKTNKYTCFIKIRRTEKLHILDKHTHFFKHSFNITAGSHNILKPTLYVV